MDTWNARVPASALGGALLVAAALVGGQLAVETVVGDAGRAHGPARSAVSPYRDGAFTVRAAEVDRRVEISSAEDGSYVLGHTPEGGDVVLDLRLMAGRTARPWWVEPATGRTLQLADLDSDRVARFPVPRGGGEDWVLVLDDVAAGYGRPDPDEIATMVDGAAGSAGAASRGGTDGSALGAGSTVALVLGAGGGDSGGSGSGNSDHSGAGSGGPGSGGADPGSGPDAADGGGAGSGAAEQDGAEPDRAEPDTPGSPRPGRESTDRGGRQRETHDGKPGDQPTSGTEPEDRRFPGAGAPSPTKAEAPEKKTTDPEKAETREKTTTDPDQASTSSKPGAPAEKKKPEKTNPEKAETPAKPQAPAKAPAKPETPAAKAPAKKAPAKADPAWDRLAECESSGDWSISTGNGYFGGLQFDAGTWRDFGGTRYAPTAAGATREQQIEVATTVRDARGGYGSWPACARKLGLPG